MIICDICKAKRANKKFLVPYNKTYINWYFCQKISRTILDKESLIICADCQSKIANFITDISSSAFEDEEIQSCSAFKDEEMQS